MAVTKRKFSYYETKSIEELRNIPNSFLPAAQTNVDNYKMPVSSVFETFPTKTELYDNFPTHIEMYDAISRISGNDGIVWIYDNGNAYNDTINALNNNKLPVYVYQESSSGGSGSSGSSGSSGTMTGLAYVKNVDDYGAHFFSLIDTNAEFTEYYIKTNNTVESTKCKNVDASLLIESNAPDIYNKIDEAISYGQTVICKSGTRYMPLAETSSQNFNTIYCFRRDGLEEHGYWYVNNLNQWSFASDY